jgi:hypothetical protein
LLKQGRSDNLFLAGIFPRPHPRGLIEAMFGAGRAVQDSDFRAFIGAAPLKDGTTRLGDKVCPNPYFGDVSR